jgi:hypothetical protein
MFTIILNWILVDIKRIPQNQEHVIFGFIVLKALNHLAFQSSDFERT